MDRAFIKEKAKELLRKNHWLCVGVAAIVALLGGMSSSGFSFNFTTNFSSSDTDATVNFPDSSSIFDDETSLIMFVVIFIAIIIGTIIGFAIKAFLGNQVKVGSCRFFLKYRKNHPMDIGEILQSYRDKTFLNVAKVTIMRDLSIMLWSMLCLIPGIIKTYEYAAVDYLLSVNPTMDKNTAFNLSKRIMDGHKMDFFIFEMSFIGWHLLAAFTCGILSFLYVNPYYMIAEAEFFASLREQAIATGVINEYEFPDYDEYAPPPPPEYTTYTQPTYTPPTYTSPTEETSCGEHKEQAESPVEPTIVEATPVEPTNIEYTPIEPMPVDFEQIDTMPDAPIEPTESDDN